MDLRFLDALITDALAGQSDRSDSDRAWYRGDLSYKLHAGQLLIDAKLKSAPGQLFVGNIARQFGKSYWAVSKAIEKALTTPRGRIKYGTAFLTDLEEFILPTFLAVLEDCPNELRPVYKVQGSKWVFPSTGAEIKLVGLDKKPNGLRGNVIDLIILDECGFINNLGELFRNVIIPATTHRPDCKIIMISTPPSTPAHPFSVDFIPLADSQDSYVKLTIHQNPMLKKQDIDRLAEALGGYLSVAFRRECLCELIIDTSIAILPEWLDVAAHTVVKPAPLPPFFKALVSIDLALNDNLGVVFGYWDFPRAKAVVQAELLLNGVNSKQLVEACLEVEKRLWGEDVTPMRWADGSLYSLNDIAAIHHYSVAPVKKDHVEAQVNDLRLQLQGKRVEIWDTCKQTIHQCGSGIWNKSKTEFARSGSNHQDLLAALIYFVRHLNKENPFPANYQYNRDTMLYRPTNVPQASQALKKAFGPK